MPFKTHYVKCHDKCHDVCQKGVCVTMLNSSELALDGDMQPGLLVFTVLNSSNYYICDGPLKYAVRRLAK